MNRTFARLIPICAVQLAAFNYCIAQNKSSQNTLQQPPTDIVIDGHLKEWGDSLRYHNEDEKLYYMLANDKDNLYMAIRINDRSEQVRILGAGLTLSIDTRGKKKETFSVTFPIGGQPGMAPNHDNQLLDGEAPSPDQHIDRMQAGLTKLRQIKVTGFKDVESELITTSNTYGFKTAIDFDKDGNLVYEAAIPLKLFHNDDLTKSEWAFNFKINGITRPQQKRGYDDNGTQRGGMGEGGMGGGRGMRGGGMGGGRGMRGGGGQGQSSDHSEMSKSVDFWTKFFLN